MASRHPWKPTVVRSDESGHIKRWEPNGPEAPCVSYSCIRRADGAIRIVRTYQEAMAFITGQHCPVLDLYTEGATTS